MKLSEFYTARSFELEEGFIKGLAGTYSREQREKIHGQIATLVAFAHESAVRQHVKPQFHTRVLEQIDLFLGDPDIEDYRKTKDVGMTFMEKCGFEQNAYIHDVGNTVFTTVKGLVKKLINNVRIEEGGI
jgi:hypothetical protein